MYFDNQGLMVMLAGVFLKKREDPSKMLRSLYSSIHRPGPVPPAKKVEAGQPASGDAAAKTAAASPRHPAPAVLAGKPADLELLRKRSQADLPSLQRYGYAFARRKPARGRAQMKLPLATTWVGYRSRSGLAQALRDAEQRLQSICSQPQVGYALSWSELQCTPRG